MDLPVAPHTFLLAALLLIVPVAVAESYTDPTGDVRARALNQWVDESPGWDGVDLTTLTLTENPSTFRFQVDMVDLSTNEGGIKHDASTYLITFQHGGKPHAVSIVRNILEDAWYGNLYEVDPATSNARWIGPLEGGGSDQAAMGWVEAPRHAFLDAQGAPPVAGHLLEDLLVTATAHTGGMVCCFNLNDLNQGSLIQAQDELTAGAYTIQFGGQEGSGGANLRSVHPFRASNGGATTLQFAVEASFEGDRDGQNRSFELRAENLPPGWSVTLPKHLTLAPGGVADLEVLIEVPFVHQHGGSDTVDIVMQANDDGPEASARLSLGLHYLDVPQPSGHHPRLWLHSIELGEFSGSVNSALGGAGGRIYMNALEKDTGDEAADVRMAQWGIGGTQYRLYACLEPSLLMGIDMDMDSTGHIELPVRSEFPTQGSLTGRLIHLAPGPELRSCYPGNWGDRTATDLATFASSAASIGSTATLLEAPIKPLPGGDRVPYADGAQLVLELIIDADDAGRLPGSLTVTPGGRLDLPLIEYRDSRPAGLVGEPVQAIGPNGTTLPTEPTARESPGAGPVLLVATIATAAVLRRRK